MDTWSSIKVYLRVNYCKNLSNLVVSESDILFVQLFRLISSVVERLKLWLQTTQCPFLIIFIIRQPSYRKCFRYGKFWYFSLLYHFSVEGRCEYGNELSTSIKFGEFVGCLMNIIFWKRLDPVELVNDFMNKIHYLQEKWQLHERNSN